MKKQTPLMPAPAPDTVEDTAMAQVEKWVEYFKTLSWRVRVIRPGDKEFNLNRFQKTVKQMKDFDEDDKLLDWPEESHVAFIVTYTTNLFTQKSRFAPENTYVFCKDHMGVFAFGLDYFDQGEENHREYSLENWVGGTLAWSHIARCIRDEIANLEKSIPEL